MIKVKEISVSFGYTKNIGNCESLRYNTSLTVEFDPLQDDLEQVTEEAYSKCKEFVKKQLLEDTKDGK